MINVTVNFSSTNYRVGIIKRTGNSIRNTGNKTELQLFVNSLEYKSINIYGINNLILKVTEDIRHD